MFRGSFPSKSLSSLMASVGTRSCTSANAGHYYLQMPKVGKLWSFGTVVPFLDFRVNPDHIMAFVQSGRMDAEDAVHQLYRTYKDLEKHIKSLDDCMLKLGELTRETYY